MAWKGMRSFWERSWGRGEYVGQELDGERRGGVGMRIGMVVGSDDGREMDTGMGFVMFQVLV